LVFATTPHGPGFTCVTRTAGEVCGTAQVVGCSAAGVLAGEEEVEGGPAVAVLALGGDFGARRFFVPLTRGRAEHVADQILDAVGEGDLRATVGVTHAVRRVSPVWRVTAARGNWLLALDGRPAYEAFASVVPTPLRADPRRALAAVLAGLLVGEDEFVARHLLALDA